MIRDTPKMSRATLDCIDRGIAARRDVGAGLRGPARDGAASATRSCSRGQLANSPRAADRSTSRACFCGTRRCYPVIGGALVFKDLHHLTLVFAETLAPPLAHEIARVTRTW